MTKIPIILKISLTSIFLIFSAFAMEKVANTNIDNLCPDLFQEILSCLIPKEFPDNKKEFIENYYKELAKLRLVNKNLKNLIDEEKIIDKFEDHLLNFIERKKLSIKEKNYLAIQVGSKKYFENISEYIQDSKIYKTKEFIQFVKKVLDGINKHYPETLANLIIEKTLEKRLFQVQILNAIELFDISETRCFNDFTLDQKYQLNKCIQNSKIANNFKTEINYKFENLRIEKFFFALIDIYIFTFLLSIFGKDTSHRNSMTKIILTSSMVVVLYILYSILITYNKIYTKKEFFAVHTSCILLYFIL